MEQSIQAIGDTALRIEWCGEVSLEMNREIVRFCSLADHCSIAGVVELVPAYNSVTIYYLPHVITLDELAESVQKILHDHALKSSETKNKRIISIPVLYGGEAGPDLDRVAYVHNLSVDEVVTKHQQPQYVVYMLGFLPGFPYLGGLDKTIATPRLETIREKTPKGSVGIAHHQTGIYPLTSPGGWNIIGRTALSLMDVSKQEPFLFQPGDCVTFYSVTQKEYEEIEQEVATGTYKVNIHT